MTYPEEGYIKYTLHWKKNKAFSKEILKDLIWWRNTVIRLGGIGYDETMKAGVGNISVRSKNNQFFISGSQTGHIFPGGNELITKVNSCNISENTVYCTGPVKASSEAMTHFACYCGNDKVNAVIHIHHSSLWKNHYNAFPATDKEIPYGTPAMAEKVAEIAKKGEGLIIMGGHKDGILILGKNLDHAGQRYLSLIKDI